MHEWINLCRAGLIALSGVMACLAADAAEVRERYFHTSDGVRLHYLEAGEGGPALVFVPGWLMPAEIFERQLSALSERHHVLALSPRSQGSLVVPCGLIDHNGPSSWSPVGMWAGRLSACPYVHGAVLAEGVSR